MKFAIFALAPLTLVSGAAAESVIVFCGNADAILRAKTIVEAGGGKIFYNYGTIGYVAYTI